MRSPGNHGGGSLAKTGEIAVARGIATAEQVERAYREGKARGEPLCSRLLAAGVDERELAAVLAEKHGVPAVDLSRSAIATELLELLPRAVAEGDLILPLSGAGDRIHLAMAKPADDRVVAEVRFVTGREVSPYIALRGALLRTIGEVYEARARGAELWRGRACASGEPYLSAVLPGADDAETVDVEPLPDEVEIEIVPGADAGERPARGAPLVLAVDDEPDIRTLVQRTLAAKGYGVELAQDGAEAVEKAERLVPDLVLLDAMLPKVHGFDACRRIKASARTRHVPVVMMTAIYRGWRFARDARESYGAVDYVEKPFRIEDLLARVEQALLSGAQPVARPDPDADPGPLVSKGKALLVDGRVPQAVEALSEAVRAHPLSAAAQYHLGRALRAARDPFAAMTALERAAELEPEHLGALRALAALYEETGFRRKAAEMLERALPAAADDAARVAIRKDLLRLIA